MLVEFNARYGAIGIGFDEVFHENVSFRAGLRSSSGYLDSYGASAP